MSKQNKKKHNPNFLTWLVDPLKGLFSPVLTGIPTVLTSTATDFFDPILGTQSPEIERSKQTVRDLLAATQKDWNPNTAKEFMEKWASDQDNAHDILYMANLAFEFATLGQIDTSLSMVYNDPMIRASFDVATEVLKTEWMAGRYPLYLRWMNQKYTPLLPEPYRLAEMAAHSRLPDDMYVEAMAQSGLSADWAGRWKELQRAILDPEILMLLRRRGVLTDKDYIAYMLWNGYNEIEANQSLHLKDVIPPLTDMIRMAVREAFGKHTYEEQMPALKEWGGKMGLTSDWVDRYWYAHWERIPLAQAYENYWRGYWDKDTFERMLRIKDVHPDDRKALMDVAFRPLSIREMGYAYDVGAIDRDDIVRYRRWGGLSPADADKAATALIDYRLNAENEALRREYMYAYSSGRMDIVEFVEKLFAMGLSLLAVNKWMIRAEYYKERMSKPTPTVAGRIISSSEAKWAFVHGLRDEAWYKTALAELDWEEDRIILAVDRAKREMVVEEVGYRKLTLTQIRDLYKFRKLESANVSAELLKIGYSPEDAANLSQILIEVVEAERIGKPVEPKALTGTDIRHFYDMGIYSVTELYEGYLKLGYLEGDAWNITVYTQVAINFPDLKAMYSKGWITADIMHEELISYGLSPDRASELMMTVIKAEQPTRLEKERDLTKSEIVKGVKVGVITPSQGASLLMDMGYDESEAWYILAINKVVAVGDPEGYYDMRKVVEAYKKAQGKPSIEIPEAVLILEASLKEHKQRLEQLKSQKALPEEIATAAGALSRIEQEMTRLLQQKGLA